MIVGMCAGCYEDILAGDEVYILGGEMWCADCVEQCKTTAEVGGNEMNDYAGG